MPTEISSLLVPSLYLGWPFIAIGAGILTVAIKRRRAKRHAVQAPVKHAALWRIDGLLWLWFVLAALWGVIALTGLVVVNSLCIECMPRDREEFSHLALSAWAIPVAIVYLIGVAVSWLLSRRERNE